MGTNLKRIVGDAIANYLLANLPGGLGVTQAVGVQQGPESNTTYPSIAVLPAVFKFEPTDADEVYENAVTDDGKVIMDVGQLEGIFELHLYAKGKPQREAVEQAIVDLFMSTVDAPGSILVYTPNLTINGYASLYQAPVVVRVDDEQWMDIPDLAFSDHRFAMMTLLVGVPVLVARNANNIARLEIDFSSDFDITITDVNQTDDQVVVNEDGSTSPAP